MALKTQPPISIDNNKIHRVYHQHHYHHHYHHLHHILDHHHLHIHNQSIFRSHVTSHQQSRLKDDGAGEPTAVAAQPVATALPDSNHQQQVHDVEIPNQLVHSRRLTHVIGASQIHLDRELNPAGIVSTHGRHHATKSATKSKQRSQIQFLLLSAFAYILSPIDIIPEAIFGIFGILDDLVFLIMCLFCVAIILLYPLIREVRRTLFDKLGLKQHNCTELDSKNV